MGVLVVIVIVVLVLVVTGIKQRLSLEFDNYATVQDICTVLVQDLFITCSLLVIDGLFITCSLVSSFPVGYSSAS